MTSTSVQTNQSYTRSPPSEDASGHNPVISKTREIYLFTSALLGCILIFGIPLIVDQIIAFVYPRDDMDDIALLLTYIAVILMVAVMINLGLFSESNEDNAPRYLFFLLLSISLTVVCYIVAYNIIEPKS